MNNEHGMLMGKINFQQADEFKWNSHASLYIGRPGIL